MIVQVWIFISPSLRLPTNFILPKSGFGHRRSNMPPNYCPCINATRGLPTYYRSIVLVGGPEDEPQGAVIAKTHSHVLNSCGLLTIQQSAYVLQHSERRLLHTILE